MKVLADADEGALTLTGLNPDEMADWISLFTNLADLAREGGGTIEISVSVRAKSVELTHVVHAREEPS